MVDTLSFALASGAVASRRNILVFHAPSFWLVSAISFTLASGAVVSLRHTVVHDAPLAWQFIEVPSFALESVCLEPVVDATGTSQNRFTSLGTL